MSSLSYRLLTAHEAEAYRQLRLRAVTDDPSAFLETADEVSAKPLQFFVDRFHKGWIAGTFADGELKAIAGLERHQGILVEHRGTIWGVFVASELRGQGCAKAMISLLIEQARVAGIEQLHLSTNVNNPASVELYRKLGFESYGIEKHMLKINDLYIDEILMVLFISQTVSHVERI